MNAWALRRKRIILLIVFLVVIIVVGVPLYFSLKPTPSCNDNKMDGDETGIDCGGSCPLLCQDAARPAVVVGDPRILSVAPDEYEVLAVIENPNLTADVFRAAYTVDIYGTSPVPQKEVKDATYIPPASTFAIFLGPFAASTTPSKATFSWDPGTLVWRDHAVVPPTLSVNNISLQSASTSTRLEASVGNDNLLPISNVELVALLIDQKANITAAGKTFVDRLGSQSSAPIIFTWPFGVASSTVVRIIPRILPDPSFIR